VLAMHRRHRALAHIAVALDTWLYRNPITARRSQCGLRERSWWSGTTNDSCDMKLNVEVERLETGETQHMLKKKLTFGIIDTMSHYCVQSLFDRE